MELGSASAASATARAEDAAWPPADPAASNVASDVGSDRAGTATGTRAAIVAGLLAVALLVPTLADLPGRFKALDMSRRHEAATWTDHVLDVMERDAMIVSWWSYSTPLWYAQRVEGRRPDITIMDDRTRLDLGLGGLTDVIDANLGKRPVYVIRIDPREVALLADRYELEFIDGRDAGALTRVIGPRQS
jgi:hypothetical protein